MLTAFNAKGPEDTASAVFDKLRNEDTLKTYKIDSYQPIYDKLELLKIKHEPIASEIANDYGTRLQYYDSCIIEKLIEYFTKSKIPILTVHDSVICQDKYSEFVRDKMWKFYRDTIDEMLKLHIEYKSINPHARYVFQIMNKVNSYFPNNKINTR